MPDLTLDLPVRGEWPNVERLRSSFDGFVLAACGDVEAGNAVALIAAELAENAIKYGHWSAGAATFRVKLSIRERLAQLYVESPIAPGAGCPAGIDGALAWIARFPSAQEAYEAKIVAVAAAGPSPETSGLGLVRVAYETSCLLRADVEGELLRVTADFAI